MAAMASLAVAALDGVAAGVAARCFDFVSSVIVVLTASVGSNAVISASTSALAFCGVVAGAVVRGSADAVDELEVAAGAIGFGFSGFTSGLEAEPQPTLIKAEEATMQAVASLDNLVFCEAEFGCFMGYAVEKRLLIDVL